jgi:hypothetical protein
MASLLEPLTTKSEKQQMKEPIVINLAELKAEVEQFLAESAKDRLVSYLGNRGIAGSCSLRLRH